MPLLCPCRSQACRFRDVQPAAGKGVALMGAGAGAEVKRLASLNTGRGKNKSRIRFLSNQAQ
eukprot:2742150-Pleurochrysis_carterae.AAC.1